MIDEICSTLRRITFVFLTLGLPLSVEAQSVEGYHVRFGVEGPQELSFDEDGRMNVTNTVGNVVTVILEPVRQGEADSDPGPAKTVNISGKVVFTNELGSIVRFDQSGLCGVMFTRNLMGSGGEALWACQTPPQNPERPLTDDEKQWVEWNALDVDGTLNEILEKARSESGRFVQFAALLPSNKTPAILKQLEAELGSDDENVLAARAIWAETEPIFGVQSDAFNELLAEALRAGDLDRVQQAIAQGAQINAVDQNGATPISIAMAAKDMELVELLVENGAEFDWSSLEPDLIGSGSDAGFVRGLASSVIARQKVQIADLEAEVAAMIAEGDRKQAQIEQIASNINDALAAEVKASREAAKEFKARLGEFEMFAEEFTARVREQEARIRQQNEHIHGYKNAIETLELFTDTQTPEVVFYVQNRLIEFGYKPGEPDGKLGEQTREAIREFQRSAGMPVTGEITAAMITSMSLGAD